MIKYLFFILLTLTLLAEDSDFTTSKIADSKSVQKIDSVMKRFDNEPSVEKVIKAALKYAHINNGDYASWISRAKNQAWLPKVYVKGRMLNTNKNALKQDELHLGSFDSSSQDITDQQYIEGKAEFDLKKLVFSADELKVNREITNSVRNRKKIIEHITKLYFNRRKNQIKLILSPPTSSKSILNAKIKIQQQTALLNALTNGYFNKNIKKRGNK